MPVFKVRREGAVTIHGEGGVGGKGEGFLALEGIAIKRAEKLRAEILATEFYGRYRGNGGKIDAEALRYLRCLHESFGGQPMGVRPSEKGENDPLLPTSGENISFMLPNSNPDPELRFGQFLQAIEHAYSQFAARHGDRGGEGIAVVLNPVHGVLDETPAGLFFYPMSSGLANSLNRFPMEGKAPGEGFARLAFGHGYATVRNDFPIIPMMSIMSPENPNEICEGQTFFYAIDMLKNAALRGADMETMTDLHVRHAGAHMDYFGSARAATFDRLLAKHDPLGLGFAAGLCDIVESIRAKSGGEFQIEFTFNVLGGRGVFHIVQYKRLRGLEQGDVRIPEDGKKAYLSTDRMVGHGVIRGIRSAVVIPPFGYLSEIRDEREDRARWVAGVKSRLAKLNVEMAGRGEKYMLVVPGRLGTTQEGTGLGLHMEFRDVSNAAVIAEYGCDIRGSAKPNLSREENALDFTSHYQWRMLRGEEATEKQRRMLAYGSQGTHFLTNLDAAGAVYLHIDPDAEGAFDRFWFFQPPEGQPESPVFAKRFPDPVTVYADLFGKRCVVKAAAPEVHAIAGHAAAGSVPGGGRYADGMRILNPLRIRKAYVCAEQKVRDAAAALSASREMPWVDLESIPAVRLGAGKKLDGGHFVLLVDDEAAKHLNAEEFRRNNPGAVVVLLSSDRFVARAPPAESAKERPYVKRADLVFAVDDFDLSAARVIPSAIRCAEDKANIEEYSKEKRFVFLVVDDEPRWFSQFLPTLYKMIGQRADIMTARTYEEAKGILDVHGDKIVCLISDIYIPRAGNEEGPNGADLVRLAKEKHPRFPIIVASKAPEAGALQDVAYTMPKGDQDALRRLETYVRDFTGLGDFFFYDEGRFVARASTLAELRQRIERMPAGLLETYAKQDFFSTWLYMHGYAEVGDRLRPRQDRGEVLRVELLAAMDEGLAKAAKERFSFLDGNGDVLASAGNLRELADCVRGVDIAVLEEYSHNDAFSMWLMRKGHNNLADELRPLHGEGEELRKSLVALLERHITKSER